MDLTLTEAATTVSAAVPDRTVRGYCPGLTRFIPRLMAGFNRIWRLAAWAGFSDRDRDNLQDFFSMR